MIKIPLSGIDVDFLFLAFLAGLILLFVLELAVDIGLVAGSDKLWARIKRRRERKPRFPWSDRTGT